MATMFKDAKGILHINFMKHGMTITSAAYCDNLKRLRRVIQNNCRGLLKSDVVFRNDNARPHTA